MSCTFMLLIGLVVPATNLVDAPGVNLVRAHCTSCHSHHLITQNRGTREDWIRTIRWMQEKQNLWAIAPNTERQIVAYLSQHYPPRRLSRRPPLHPSLMPSKAINEPKPLPGRPESKAAVMTQPKPSPSNGCSCTTSCSPSTALFSVIAALALIRRFGGS